MGELERRTGVHREVIRLMLREGLLPEPKRPSPNSAIYSEAHVSGIEAVRELQRSSRLTLKEIKAAMQGAGLVGDRPMPNLQRLRSLLQSRFTLEKMPAIKLSSLSARLPFAEHDAAVFAKMGMLTLKNSSDGGVTLSFEDTRLLEIWSAIREAGFIEEIGFPPENIGFYLEAAREVARHEAKTFFRDEPLPMNEEQAASMLHTALPLMLEFFGLLRFKCFLEEIDKQSGS